MLNDPKMNLKHALALTVTGRVLGWGDNSSGQNDAALSRDVCSLPTVQYDTFGLQGNTLATVKR